MPGTIAIGLLVLLAGANPSWPAPDPNLEPEALSRPGEMPDDPEYPPGAECTGQLELYSFTPACTPNVEHAALGSGIHADRAWLLTIGRPEVTLAFVGDGADFSDPDLIARYLLNPGELPAPSTSSTAHDANGDGAFTVLDYTTATGTVPPTIDRVNDRTLLARPDHGDANGNGLLDPGDLIAIFSDGADDDLDGYRDDIAGWDFLDDDNDPSDPSTAGASEARRAVAVANNGIGGAGVCPACTLLSLRAGSGGLGEAHRIAVAIAYAVDRGAAVVASSLEAPDHDEFLESAADYAFGRGIPLVASSGVGSAVAPAIAWPPDRVLTAGGLRYDRSALRDATTALAADPCASFGPRLDVSTPTRCDTAGAGLAAGVLGLMRSVERGVARLNIPALERPLDAAEMMLIAAGNTDDASGHGWDQHTGFGRLNARAALDAVIRRRIPVPAELTSPGWFEILDPTGKDTLPVTGVVMNRRYDRATWQLAYAVGIDPEDGEFISLGTDTVAKDQEGTISGALPARGLFDDPAAPPARDDALAVTIRLRTSATSGGDVVTGEIRRVVFVQRDLQIFPAFPLALHARPSSPRITDLDGDGATEIAIATSQGTLHLIGVRGATRPGWPRRGPVWSFPALHGDAPAFRDGALDSGVREPFLGAVAVAPGELAAVTSEGSVLALDAAGELLPGFPVRIPRGSRPIGIADGPALEDLDGDGVLEILIPDGAGALHAFTEGGGEVTGFPIDVGEPVGAPAIGDLDGDARPEVVFASDAQLFVFHSDGSALEGWPIAIADGPAGPRPPAPVLADTDGDGRLEIVLAALGRPLAVFRSDGEALVTAVAARAFGPGSDVSLTGAPIVAAGEPSIADLDGDGGPDAFLFALPENDLAGPSPGDEIERLAGVWSLRSGGFLAAYPRRTHDPSRTSAVAADVDGDHRPELITGDGRYRLAAFSVNGRSPPLWPKLTGGTADGSPAAGDLDGDGNLDLAAATREGALFAWRTQSAVDGVVWESVGHDNRATRNAATSLSVHSAPAPGHGCRCSARAEGRSPPLAGLLLLAWVRFAQRRRRRTR